MQFQLHLVNTSDVKTSPPGSTGSLLMGATVLCIVMEKSHPPTGLRIVEESQTCDGE